MTLTTQLAASIHALLEVSADHGSPQAELDNSYSRALPTGTGSGAADVCFSDRRTLAASADETLDLTSLTNALGVSISFAKVKAILITASADNTNSVIVGNATNPFAGPLSDGTTTITVPPGGMVMLTAPAAGWAVTGGSADEIKLQNSSSGSAVTYDITIIGTSA